MKLNWNFQRGGRGVLKKIPSMGEVWIFCGITQVHFGDMSRACSWINNLNNLVGDLKEA